MSLQKPSQDTLYRYTQRKLSEEEEEQVELWLMENPEGLEEVRLDGVLRGGAASSQSAKPWLSMPRWLHAIAYATLATVAIYPHIHGQSDHPSVAPANIVTLNTLRSVDDDIAQLRPDAESVTVIQVPVAYMSTESYDATLTRDGATVLSVSALQPSSSDLVAVMIGAGAMEPGEYRLELVGTSSGEQFVSVWRAAEADP
ncbi:MAG: hypothetical protein DHS20C11_30170 [Lysobacteraceae bacterium]|nr:MAG: hypothetical protein DHS20C11_30170 [Xanthomonadaceae bacterium]